MSRTKETNRLDATFVTRNLLLAAALYLLGFLLFLVAFSTPTWLDLDQGMQCGLWGKCHLVNKGTSYWDCESWDSPTVGFITASQAFAVMALLLYIGLFIIMTGIVVSMVHNIPYKRYVDRRCILMLLAVGAFSAACLSVMSATVMGIKGKDYIHDLKRNDYTVFAFGQKSIDITGPVSLGWSFVVNILGAIFTYFACFFYAAEYKSIPPIDIDSEDDE